MDKNQIKNFNQVNIINTHSSLFSIEIWKITLFNNENVSGSKIADSCVFPPAKFKNHHKNYRLALVFEILSAKTTKKAILTYFRVPLDIKQQYLKSKYLLT